MIATRIGGVAELVKDGENGVLFTPAGVADLKRAILTFGESRKDFFNSSQQIRNSVVELGIKNYALKLLGLIQHGGRTN